MTPGEMATRISQGLLSFPVTHFDDCLDFNETGYRSHISWLLEHHPAAIFAAAGTGEFFSLTFEEFARVVSAAVSEVAGRIPVIAGCGYGTRTAIQLASAADGVGADALLLFPPYLVNADPAGLINHVRAVCASTSLGIIFYNRDNGVLDESALEELCRDCPNLIGFKDGLGDLELMTRISARLGDRLIYIGGLPRQKPSPFPIWKSASPRILRRSSIFCHGSLRASKSLSARQSSQYSRSAGHSWRERGLAIGRTLSMRCSAAL